MFLIYDFIFSIYSLIYLPYALLTGRLYQGFEQRLGFLPDSLKNLTRPVIWVHAVSVGEVLLGEVFIRRLQAKHPSHQIVFSVTTKTGFALAQKKLSSVATVIASPLDFSFIVASVVRRINPTIYIALETEIWPNLFTILQRRRIPIAIINGRISDASFGRYQAIAFLLKSVLARVSCFCMQSPLDAKRIIAIGAEEEKVVVTGNIKFDESQKVYIDLVNEDIGQGPWFIAGSTHIGEEEIILDVYKRVLANFPSWRLILVPRHVERSAQVVALVRQKGFRPIKWTERQGALADASAIIVVDAIGHLRSLYAKASLVFVGKSLCGGGGQNIIEPAAFAKAIIVGDRMENFRDITACFNKEQAIVQVADALEFEAAVRDLMGDSSKRDELGRRARGVIDANQGAGTRTLSMLEKYLS